MKNPIRVIRQYDIYSPREQQARFFRCPSRTNCKRSVLFGARDVGVGEMRIPELEALAFETNRVSTNVRRFARRDNTARCRRVCARRRGRR